MNLYNLGIVLHKEWNTTLATANPSIAYYTIGIVVAIYYYKALRFEVEMYSIYFWSQHINNVHAQHVVQGNIIIIIIIVILSDVQVCHHYSLVSTGHPLSPQVQ